MRVRQLHACETIKLKFVSEIGYQYVRANVNSMRYSPTLDIVGAGPRCRPLASAGKVSAAKATDPKLDSL